MVAVAAVLLSLVIGQSLAADDKQEKTVKGRIETLEGLVKDLQDDRDGLQERVTDLEDLLAHSSRDDDDIYITGANLHVVNGTGSTGGTPNGLGNIIIGYNEKRTGPWEVNDRTGSHMLVVGTRHNYAGFGGIVVGDYHTVNGIYA